MKREIIREVFTKIFKTSNEVIDSFPDSRDKHVYFQKIELTNAVCISWVQRNDIQSDFPEITISETLQENQQK